MAKQRYKRIQAGHLVREALWTPVFPNDTPKQREAKSRVSSAARRKINQRCAWQKLEAILGANFGGKGIHVVLTYEDAALPATVDNARKLVRKFLAQLRVYRRDRKEELYYVYNIEGRHSKGRFHHHLVVNGSKDDLSVLRSLWPYGVVRWGGHIDDYGYAGLAQYLTKEAREDGAPVGARSWVGSRNLAKPEAPPAEWVPASVTLAPPVNAYILERESKVNEFGRYEYIEYLLPCTPVHQVARPRRKTKNSSQRKIVLGAGYNL